MATHKLSARQERILKFIDEFLEEHHYPPTVRDIQLGCEVSSTSVVDYNLKILNREGYIRRESGVSRGIELVGGSTSWRGGGPELLQIPVLGSIAAGEPLPVFSSDVAVYDEFENVELPPSLVNAGSQVYALRVKGTSMIDALVADGDLVLLEPTESAENGQMVVAMVEEEGATLKRFYLQGDTVRLQPENEMMEPIEVPADQVAVRGRVIGVFRAV